MLVHSIHINQFIRKCVFCCKLIFETFDPLQNILHQLRNQCLKRFEPILQHIVCFIRCSFIRQSNIALKLVCASTPLFADAMAELQTILHHVTVPFLLHILLNNILTLLHKVYLDSDQIHLCGRFYQVIVVRMIGRSFLQQALR
jgi:hypothetical protein